MEDARAAGQSADDRKAIRRSRVTRREAAKSDDARTKRREGSEAAEAGIGRAQVAETLAALDHLKSRTIDEVTAVRVEADTRENARRIEEEDKRQDRLWRLQEEAVASGKDNAAVEMSWNDLLEYNMPQVRWPARTQRTCVRLVSVRVCTCTRLCACVRCVPAVVGLTGGVARARARRT